MAITRLALTSIRVDGGTQARARLDVDAIAEYVAVLGELPPPVVFHDGDAYWLADGFHRVAAHREAGSVELGVDVRHGSQRDARLFAVGANAAHGVRRTNRDKRAAVALLLEDTEWSTWSDHRIAEACGVTQPFVSQLRRARDGVESVITPLRTAILDDAELAGDAGLIPPAVPELELAASETMGGIDDRRVWLVPTEGDEARSLEGLLDALQDGVLEQACMRARADTGAAWFGQAWDYPLCFLAGRPDVVLYLGPRLELFERAFAPLGRIVVPTPYGTASLRSRHLRLCAACKQPCSTGRWCQRCKQFERSDRAWMRSALTIAERELVASREPSPRKIAVRVHRPWRDVVQLLVRQGVGDDAMRARWQREAHLARKGE